MADIDLAGGQTSREQRACNPYSDAEKEKEPEARVEESQTAPAAPRASSATGSTAVDLEERQGPVLLTGIKFWTMYACMVLSTFIVALDVTIVSTAQTVIVADVGGVDQISWIVTAFLLTSASFMLFYGQVLTNFPSKACYLSAILFFELGSLICAVAQNMNTVIVGRAIAGVGASGIMICAMTVLAETTTLHQRAALVGGLGVVYGVSMVLGPLIGGAIAQHIGWRWNFIINLPCGALSIASIVLLQTNRPPLGHLIHKPMPLREKLEQLDFVGLFISLGFLVAITLPLQDGFKYTWTDGRILGPLIASAFILALLIAWCAYRGREHALIPLALLQDRNLVGCAIVSCLCYIAVLVNLYYLPRFYQAVFGSSPTRSGVDLLPTVIALSLVSLFGGIAATKTGHYYTQMAVAPIFGTVGSVMLYRMDFDTSRGYLIGAQILTGIAMGACIQTPMLAAQANVKREIDTSRAVGFVTFVQRFGGSIGNGIASAIFYSMLPQELRKNNVPSEWASRTLSQPETLRSFPAGPIRDGAQQAFTRSIADVLVIGVPAMALDIILILLLIKCTNLKTKKVTPLAHMPAAVLAALTGRRRKDNLGPTQQQDDENAARGTDFEKGSEGSPEVERKDWASSGGGSVPDVVKEDELLPSSGAQCSPS
ncbi:hypothetical protein A4X13_0g7204 [Tilletia indica]|uniref:Major facilitator superfamily (MFS) profile domain-containing protein n=1 Tax=Tilletia indica TaxID=43049 RepID=A0A177TWK4_9BASI|nr:hypothetical protein A4X13_0g7204 [Tilletia indica]